MIEKSTNCALAHCSWKNTAENFDRHVTQTLCQNYSQRLCCDFDHFQSKEPRISKSSIHPQNLRGHPDGFFRGW